VEVSLQAELQVARQAFNTNAVKFAHVGNTHYLLEVPKKASKLVPPEYRVEGGTATVRRFSSAALTRLASRHDDTVVDLEGAARSAFSRVLTETLRFASVWRAAARYVAELDALVALSVSADEMCEPTTDAVFVDLPLPGAPTATPTLDMVDVRHPTLSHADPSFVPNTVQLTPETPGIVLTGPNMGGKSTLIRTVGTNVVLAAVGAALPATKVSLVLPDRLFCRAGGGGDAVAAGRSTFAVELIPAAAALANATPSSLVLLDELGRGTSAVEGEAIAGAVLSELVEREPGSGVRTILSTHFTSITSPRATAYHLATVIAPPPSRTVSFTYTLARGPSPASLAVRVAALAGIPPAVCAVAEAEADRRRRGVGDGAEAGRILGELMWQRTHRQQPATT